MAFWHGRVLTATYYFRRRGIVVMISENFDGEWIARIIEQFGFRTSRGSTSRGGQRALLQLKREMDAGSPSGFAVDGPRGPARKAQPGAVWLAKLTGNPVVPFHMEASSYWSLKSWDRTQIPQPFSTVALAVGAPIDVPRDADEAMLEAKRVEVEQSLFAVGAASGGDARVGGASDFVWAPRIRRVIRCRVPHGCVSPPDSRRSRPRATRSVPCSQGRRAPRKRRCVRRCARFVSQ